MNTPHPSPDSRLSSNDTLSSTPRPIAGVIAVVMRDGNMLLVRRKNPPDAGLWGFPGGKIEFGEAVEDAALRELLEETGVYAESNGVLTAIDAYDKSENGELWQHFVLLAVLCTWIAGEPVAADDAAEAGWFPMSALHSGELALSLDVEKVAQRAIAANAALRG